MKYFTTMALALIVAASPGAASAGTRHENHRKAPASANGCDVAREYVRLIGEGQYDRVGDLWAQDAVFYSPAGKVVQGREAISAFYARFLRQITPTNRIASLAWDPAGRVCVMELETRVALATDGKWMPDEHGRFLPTAIDRFVVNDARLVQQMRVYLAPANPWLAE